MAALRGKSASALILKKIRLRTIVEWELMRVFLFIEVLVLQERHYFAFYASRNVGKSTFCERVHIVS